jgi:hypothetical protein
MPLVPRCINWRMPGLQRHAIPPFPRKRESGAVSGALALGAGFRGHDENFGSSSVHFCNEVKDEVWAVSLSHTRRLTQRKQHRSDHGNMIAVVGKSTDLNVFSALPLDALSGVGLRQLSHPFQYFLFGGLTGPMQSSAASDDRSLNNLRIGGSKEDGPPNYSISPVDHCVPPTTPDQMSPCCRLIYRKRWLA